MESQTAVNRPIIEFFSKPYLSTRSQSATPRKHEIHVERTWTQNASISWYLKPQKVPNFPDWRINRLNLHHTQMWTFLYGMHHLESSSFNVSLASLSSSKSSLQMSGFDFFCAGRFLYAGLSGVTNRYGSCGSSLQYWTSHQPGWWHPEFGTLLSLSLNVHQVQPGSFLQPKLCRAMWCAFAWLTRGPFPFVDGGFWLLLKYLHTCISSRKRCFPLCPVDFHLGWKPHNKTKKLPPKQEEWIAQLQAPTHHNCRYCYDHDIEQSSEM